MASAAMTYVHEDTGVFFEWHGGEYIEVWPYQGFDYPTDVINVWDHAAGEASIDFSLDAFQEACDDWIDNGFE